MNNNIGELMIELRIATRHACYAENSRGSLVSLKTKVLYLTSLAPRSPMELMEKLCIVKSNLALLCNNMIEEGVIYKEKTSSDKRAITYKITPKGRSELQSTVQVLSDRFKNVLTTEKDAADAADNIEAVLKLLSFI